MSYQAGDGFGLALFDFLTKLVTLSGTTLTVDSTYKGVCIRCTSGSATTITLPNNLPAGFSMTVVQIGAGQVTFVAASGATLVNRQTQLKTAGQYAGVSLYVDSNSGTNGAWVLFGDTAA